MTGLASKLWEARAAFLMVREPGRTFPLDFWLNMMEAQVIEAREHLANGLPEKAKAEIADCFIVGWQALHDNGSEPERFIMDRMDKRVIPRAKALHDRYQGGNGFKPVVIQDSHSQAYASYTAPPHPGLSNPSPHPDSKRDGATVGKRERGVSLHPGWCSCNGGHIPCGEP